MIIIISVFLIILSVVMLLRSNKPGAIVCVVLMLLLSVLRVVMTPSKADMSDKIDKKSKQVETSVFAEKIKTLLPDKNIKLIILPSYDTVSENIQQHNKSQKLLINSLNQNGLDIEILTLSLRNNSKEKPVLRNGEQNVAIGSDLAYLNLSQAALESFKHAGLKKVLASLDAESDAVICSFPFMGVVSANNLLAKKEGPALVLLHTSIDDVAYALSYTVLEGVLKYKPNASWTLDHDWSLSAEEAFDEHYEFITAEKPP